jgi:hypothetical protein
MIRSPILEGEYREKQACVSTKELSQDMGPLTYSASGNFLDDNMAKWVIFRTIEIVGL